MRRSRCRRFSVITWCSSRGAHFPSGAWLLRGRKSLSQRGTATAKTVIDGETVVVSSDQVTTPVAVRYDWANNPPCFLYNAADLPASPFRTDH